MASERDISQLLFYMREECQNLIDIGQSTIRITCKDFMSILDKAESNNTYGKAESGMVDKE